MDEFFLSRCKITFTDRSIQIKTPNTMVALALKNYKTELAQWAINFRKELTQVFFPGCKNRPFEFPTSLIEDNASHNCLGIINWLASQKENYSMVNFDINPARDADIATEAFHSEYPVWVTRMTDQKVMLCNQLAINTQQKDPTELLGESIVPLWDNDPLEVMVQYLTRDQQLTNYENPGYRWVREGDSPIWKRAKYIFVTDYRLVTFLGQPCRISFTKSAEPV